MGSSFGGSTVRRPAIFDLTDPAERFIVERIQFFFSEQPALYRVLAMRRVDAGSEGGRQRLVLQAIRRKAQRTAVRPEWFVMVWDIDSRSVTFLKRSSRVAMLGLYRSFAPAAVAAQRPSHRGTSSGD